MRDRHKIIQMFQNLHESPDAKEEAILEENRLSLFDPEIQAFVQSFYMESDRHSSLRRFLAATSTKRIIDTVEKFSKGNKKLAICEIGAGNGFLALALIKAGFSNVDILEPSSNFITGTGFMRDLSDAQKITVFNDLDSWYSSNKRYDILITNACIHHFNNPLFVMSQIRLKSHLNTIWLAFNEYIAVDYADLINQLLNHRHATLYGLYEFPYSHRLYRNMFSSAGFKPLEIEPPATYGEMALPNMLWKYAVVKKIDQIVWKILCHFCITWSVYDMVSFIVSCWRRNKIRKIDPFCMAFKAKPIGWANVKPNPRFFKAGGVMERPQVITPPRKDINQ